MERETFRLIRDNLGEANLFSVGIGSSVNRHLVEGMARAGMGEAFVATSSGEASRSAEKLLTYIASPVLTNIRASFPGLDAYDVVPTTIPDVLAERPIIIVGKYRGEARGGVALQGLGGQGRFATELPMARSRAGNRALRYLWARTRIQQLEDDQSIGAPDAGPKIRALGLVRGRGCAGCSSASPGAGALGALVLGLLLLVLRRRSRPVAAPGGRFHRGASSQ